MGFEGIGLSLRSKHSPGEMQIHLWEDSLEYMQVDDCIAQIQDFLDWDQQAQSRYSGIVSQNKASEVPGLSKRQAALRKSGT